MIGTLLQRAEQSGMNLAPWRARAGLLTTAAIAPAPMPLNGAFFQPVPFNQLDLRPVPWTVTGLAIRGDLTVLAAPGGGAKTVALIDLSVCVAAGLPAWGTYAISPRHDGRQHRVAIISAEEDRDRIALLVAAACQRLKLKAAERAMVGTNLIVHDARQSGFRVGSDTEGLAACQRLQEALQAGDVSLAVLDTLAALLDLPNENDNTMATRLLRELGRASSVAGCAVILAHHTPKMTRDGAAAMRGEATVVRGGGAITASARIVVSLTGVPATEAGLFVMAGMKVDTIRRIDTVKMNDAANPDPVFLEIVSEPVRVADGSTISVRAINFITAPQAGSGAIPVATMNVVMRAIDAGVLIRGAKVALSRTASKDRSAVVHVANALRAADPSLPEVHARTAARDVLGYLTDTLGCVVEADLPIPKYTAKGTLNGHDMRKGLATRWNLAPWAATGLAPVAAAVVPPVIPPLPAIVAP